MRMEKQKNKLRQHLFMSRSRYALLFSSLTSPVKPGKLGRKSPDLYLAKCHAGASLRAAVDIHIAGSGRMLAGVVFRVICVRRILAR